MDLTLIQGAMSGLKAASDIAKGILELKSISDVQGKVIELQSAILSAQSSALAAVADQTAAAEELRAIKAELDELKRWDQEQQRYALVSPFQGAVVYALRRSHRNGEPPHWLCTRCFQDGKKSMLQKVADEKSSWTSVGCSRCGAKFQTTFRGPAMLQFVEDYEAAE